jgi:putative transposase
MLAQQEGGRQVGKTRWTHYSIAYHLVWIPKYRRKILTSEVEQVTKDHIGECCERHGFAVLALETDQDHVQVIVSAPPRFSPAMLTNLRTGYSSRYLRERFLHLKRVCGTDHLWTQSSYVGTAGGVSAETIQRSIMECQGK